MNLCVHLGAAAINSTPKDWEGNCRTLLSSIEQAKARGVEILCLPELAMTGYGCEDEFHAPYVASWALDLLFDELLPASLGMAITVGLPLAHEGATYNCTALLVNGELAGFVAKQNLAGDGIHYEPRFFKAWPKGRVASVECRGKHYPLGDLIFDLDGIRVGLEICEDAWVAGRPGVDLAAAAVDIILNPSASHFALQKAQTRERFVQEGSRAFHCAYVYANLLGNEAGRAIYDGDCLIATEGELIARNRMFLMQPCSLIDARVDLQANRVRRLRQASYRPEPAHPLRMISVPWRPGSAAPGKAQDLPPRPDGRFEEFELAMGLALFDYMRKSSTKGFAISLSGGADSSACLMLVYRMACRLLEEQPDHPTLKWLCPEPPASVEELMQRICICAYQSSANSGPATLEAAQRLAEGCGARFVHLDVTPMVTHLEEMLASVLQRELTWEQDDLARQNIQARSRAPGIWALANAYNFLLLSTSNRSEAAVGYCTMDGDTAGSLSPIAGIDKVFLREWLRWAEQRYMPALNFVNQLAPTAELRPAAAAQTDEADLMPYPVLNRIQKLAVIQKKAPSELYPLLEEEYPDQTPQTLYGWIERYFQLWSRNQWKRERYAPSFHVDDENLDPRSWCRYPILSGNYRAELKRLREELEATHGAFS